MSFIPKKRERTILVDFQIGFHTLDDVEQYFIMGVLDHFEGNRSDTAATLGISRRTLQRKLERYGKRKYKLNPQYYKLLGGENGS